MGQMRTAKLLSSQHNPVAWFRLELLSPVPRQDERMDMNYQITNSADVLRRLCIFSVPVKYFRT